VRFNSSGADTVFATSGLDHPIGLAFDSRGDLYAANWFSGTIEEFDSSGVGTVFASGLLGPSFIAAWPDLIPEPSSLLLTALGAVTLCAFVKRKRAL
jgi:hypothetical protein